MPRLAIFAFALSFLTGGALQGAGLTPRQTAERIDVLLSKELSGLVASDAPAMQSASDEVFLRRASLDLIGRPPTAEEMIEFQGDAAPTRHAAAVDRYLQSPEFGTNWGRYWRDAILMRRTEPRAEFMGPIVVDYIAERYNENAGWDRVAKEMVTAKGSVRENGATAIIYAQSGNAEEIAAEVSRLFLGVQIQCAQCHDHPTDRWERRQFHELASFFARVETKVVRGDGMKVDFAVIGRDRGPIYAPPMPNGRNRSLEHFMPDMNDPKARGTIVQPVLFLTGQKIDTGKTDELRRDVLAAWMTDPKNSWFAKAMVNRVWTELVGWGFYEPVDDLGPDRDCRAPKTLDLLASQFIEHDYQIKWLYRAIMATDAYRRAPGDVPYLTMQPTRLRSDQLYDSIIAALDVDDLYEDLTPRRGLFKNIRGPRHDFAEEFGFDPSEPRADQAGSIPQALMLMNTKPLHQAIDAGKSKTMLGKLLAASADDQQVATWLYARCLARRPTEQEMATCLAHVKETNNRAEAFEDILWSLLNSTEILERR